MTKMIKCVPNVEAVLTRAIKFGRLVFARPTITASVVCLLVCMCFGGDVLNDAEFCWGFDTDINGDGILQTNEVRDVRHFGACTANGYTGDYVPTSIRTINGNRPTCRSGSVPEPLRGIVVERNVLHVDVSNNTSQAWGTGFTIPGTSVRNSQTLIARIRADSFNGRTFLGTGGWTVSYLMNNGRDDSQNAGTLFGFTRATSGQDSKVDGNHCPVVVFGASTVQCLQSEILLTTNRWYDIAYSISDDGNGAATVLFAVATVADVETAGIRSVTKTVSSGGFGDESRSTGEITIGGKVPGSAQGQWGGQCFAGDIDRIALWDRALTPDEIARVFASPQPMVEIGIDNDSGDEFAPIGEETGSFVVGSDHWCRMKRQLSMANETLSFKVVPDVGYMGVQTHVLTVKSTRESGSASLLATVKVWNADGTLKKESIFKARTPYVNAEGKFYEWELPAGCFVCEYTNEVMVTLLKESSTPVVFDKVSVSGSWRLGYFDSKSTEFGSDNTVRTAYVGNRNLKAVPCVVHGLGVAQSTTNMTIRTWLPQEMASRYGFQYKTRVIGQGAPKATYDDYGYVPGQFPFSIAVNGVVKYSTAGVANGTDVVLDIAPDDLRTGWNDIRIFGSGGGVYWCKFDAHQFEVKQFPKLSGDGFVIILR